LRKTKSVNQNQLISRVFELLLKFMLTSSSTAEILHTLFAAFYFNLFVM